MTALLEAILTKDPSAVRAVATREALSQRDPEGRQPLAFAVARGAPLELLQVLLDAGADVNDAQPASSEEEVGWTPLHHASLRGDEAIVALLLERRALARGSLTDLGITPLALALMGHHPGIAQRLLIAGADANQPLAGQTPPLHRALLEWKSRAKNKVPLADAMLRTDVRLLLEHGASATARLPDGETALTRALLAKAPADVVLALVRAGAPLTDRVSLEQGKVVSPAALAIGLGQPVEVLIAMLEQDLDTEARTEPDAQNLLHFAAMKRVDAVEAILTRRPQQPIDARDDTQSTALFLASWVGLEGAVTRLLARGASVNLPDDGGNTPLHTAAKNGHRRIVEALLAAGADRTVQNASGQTAADRARAEGEGAIEALLRA